MIAIRDACAEDAPALATLIVNLGYPDDAQGIWRRIEKMPPEFYRTLVAVSENRVVGFIGLLTMEVYEHSQPIGYILAMCVAPESRGKGIGKALLAAAEEHFRARGIFDLRLGSAFYREEAHRFYENAGFEKTGYRFRKKLSRAPSPIP